MENIQSNKTGLQSTPSTSQRPIEMTRNFNAPIDQVWKAWSEPELTKQWWGPSGFTAPVAEIDFRVGGRYLLAMRAPDGKVFYSTGTFTEIVPLKKIAYSDQFSDADGNPTNAKDYGMPGEWPDVMMISVNFTKINLEETKITLTHEGIPAEAYDDCVDGWTTSLDKFQKLVERS